MSCAAVRTSSRSFSHTLSFGGKYGLLAGWWQMRFGGSVDSVAFWWQRGHCERATSSSFLIPPYAALFRSPPGPPCSHFPDSSPSAMLTLINAGHPEASPSMSLSGTADVVTADVAAYVEV
eukprot:279930-Chlamydomonas_euryale.AAC.2